MVGYGVRLCIVAILFITVCSVLNTVAVSASGSWTSGSLTFGERKLQSISTQPSTNNCQSRTVTITGASSMPEQATVCVYDRPSFRYAAYNKYINQGWNSFSENYFIVGLGADQNMYVVGNMSSERMPLDVPSSDDLHFNTLTMGFTNNHLLSYVPDFHTKLRKATGTSSLATRYELISSSERPFIEFTQTNRSYVTTGAYGLSKDGDWMVVELMDAGLALINTSTRELRGFSNYRHNYGVGSDAHMKFVISNDGTKVAAFDYNITPTVYTLDDACVVKNDKYTNEFVSKIATSACPTDNFAMYHTLNDKYGYRGARSKSATEFSIDGDALYFDDYEYDWMNWSNTKRFRTALYPGDYKEEASVDYIALGDSFTSGEGDIEKKTDGSAYYLKGTDKIRECHLSSRSYPFLLGAVSEMSSSRTRSVACSGAQILPDYITNSNTYEGQAQRIKSLSNADKEKAKSDALNNFNPGVIPQIEFVKKYQPKTITLMGGGNDVGFAKILEYCASPTLEGIWLDGTCGYAVEGSSLRKMLAQSILSQYDYTLLLISKIRQASPDTTMYIVGYPSFISEAPNAICLNSGALVKAERTMIHEGVTFMNAMLEDAAKSGGVKYIDIQDTLNGGRMCEGSEYITGLNDIGYDRDTYATDSFHPNAKAHQKFSERITSQGFSVGSGRNTMPLSKPAELEIPSYFGGVEKKQTKQLAMMNDVVKEQEKTNIFIPKELLASNSSVALTVYSNPTKLSNIMTNSDGGVNTNFQLPESLKLGRHVLVLDGTSPSGEAVQYFQFITVVGPKSADQDNDGILDDKDACLFITTWVDEANGEDKCKVKVSTAPVVSNDGKTQSIANDKSNIVTAEQPNQAGSELLSQPSDQVVDTSQRDTLSSVEDPEQGVLGAESSSANDNAAITTSGFNWLPLVVVGVVISAISIRCITVKLIGT